MNLADDVVSEAMESKKESKKDEKKLKKRLLKGISTHKKISFPIIIGLSVLAVLVILNYFREGLLWSVFSNILWWAFIIFIGVLSYLQFKNDKIKSGILFLIVVIILIAYRISYTFGFLGDFSYYFSSLSNYYTSLFPTLPIWFLVFAIILIGLALYNFKKEKWGVGVLILILVFILWIFSSYIQDVVAPKIEATSIGGGITSGLMKIKLWFENPEKFKESLVQGSKFGPEVKEKEPMKGVKIVEFSPIYDNFLPGKPVDFSGRVHIDAIEDPSGVKVAKVSLYCEAEDKNKNIKKGLIRVDGVSDKFEEVANINIGRSSDYSLWCNFKEGFKVESGKETSTVIVKLIAVYDDFVTQTKLPISTVVANTQTINLEEIEEKVKIQYGPTEESRAACISGCALTKSSLLTSKQPLVEDVVFNLKIILLRASDWYGKIVKIESVELARKPSKVTLEESCDFKKGMNEKIVNYNEALEKNKEVDLVFYCDFKVNPDEEFETSFFRVDVKYDYAVEARKPINIIKEREA